jgi:ATP-dependent RNA helicase DDX10/DBP4
VVPAHFSQGFSQTLNAILENLPKTRQTMLFSATQTRSVKDLARLSLRDPEYVAVHAEATSATPLKLRQVRVHNRQLLSMLGSVCRG